MTSWPRLTSHLRGLRVAGPGWKTEKTEESREWSDMAVCLSVWDVEDCWYVVPRPAAGLSGWWRGGARTEEAVRLSGGHHPPPSHSQRGQRGQSSLSQLTLSLSPYRQPQHQPGFTWPSPCWSGRGWGGWPGGVLVVFISFSDLVSLSLSLSLCPTYGNLKAGIAPSCANWLISSSMERDLNLCHTPLSRDGLEPMRNPLRSIN